ncbi:MAG: hypothetical protein KJP00_14270 [Bacteroidia bacterium]|nr:hypothetical protein [Bacteroidia bacterium]
MNPTKDLKILLIQLRLDESMIPIERAGFVASSGLAERHWETLDVFRNPDFQPAVLDNYDAFVIGGLSDDPSDTTEMPPFFEPWLQNLFRLMQYGIEIKKPGLLSCGGFMLASHMLGAEIVIDPDQRELGIYTLTLSDIAKNDILFKTLPNEFKAVSGHIKSTNTLPSNCELLVSSERCPIHGFKVKNAPFYAFQFHPEIQCKDLEIRVTLYKEKYFETEEAYLEFIANMADTSIANSIVVRFLTLVEHHKSS